MKFKIHILSIFVFAISWSFAQEDAVNKAAQMLQEKNFEGAIPLLDQASTHAKTATQAKTWYYRSFAYKDRYNAKKDTNDRNEVVKSLQKVFDLDANNEYKETCSQLMKYISTSVYNDAVKELNNQNYVLAHKYYDKYIDVLKQISPSEITAELLFYAGYTAYMAKDMEPARLYFEEARTKNYDDPLLYEFLGREYWELGQKEKSIEILEEGSQKHPRNKDILLIEIDYLLKMGNTSEATEKLDKAIMLDPTNIDLKVLQAQLYDMQAKFDKANASALVDKARAAYTRVLDQNANHFKANFNIGTSYYNQGVNMMNDMDDDDDDLFALMDIQDQCIDLFKMALPHMEKCQQMEPQNKDVLVALSGIYFALNYAEKGKEVQEQISALEQKGK